MNTETLLTMFVEYVNDMDPFAEENIGTFEREQKLLLEYSQLTNDKPSSLKGWLDRQEKEFHNSIR